MDKSKDNKSPGKGVSDKKKDKKSFEFSPGDTIKVHYIIREGDKTRVQPFEGIVIAKKGKGPSRTFTVRRVKAGEVGVERIIPIHSPNIENIEIIKKAKARRAKLYYIRGRKGRKAMEV